MSESGLAFLGLLASTLKAPSIWAEALRAAFAVGPRRWWATDSHMPLPDKTYLAWRSSTAYGDGGPAHGDFVGYLEWRRRQRKLRV